MKSKGDMLREHAAMHKIKVVDLRSNFIRRMVNEQKSHGDHGDQTIISEGERLLAMRVYTFKCALTSQFQGQCTASSLEEANAIMAHEAAHDGETWQADDMIVNIWPSEPYEGDEII